MQNILPYKNLQNSALCSYYNYKGFFNIVLLAVVNAEKEFIMVDAGMNGRISDGGVLFYTNLANFSSNVP